MSELGLPTRLAAVAVGAASAVAVERATVRLFPAYRADLGAVGLITAAGIYPAARRRRWLGLASVRELAGVAVAGALTAASAKAPPGRDGDDTGRRAVIAAGWVAHAAFDHFHHAGSGGRLPRWYPALCAGYDIAFAAMLMRPNPPAVDEAVISQSENQLS
jgi:hypothetical protein